MAIRVYHNDVEVPMTLETLIDAGVPGFEPTEEELRELFWPSRWSQMPWWERTYLHVRYGYWRYDLQHRLSHAWSALRGIDCEP